MRKNDGRKLPPDAQEALRRRVVEAIEGGMKQREAVAAFGLSRSAITNWLAAYRGGGAAALKSNKRGPKGGGALTPGQTAQTVRAITDRCPDQLKLPFALWTREAVAELIERRFGLRRSVWTVGRYLRGWGFTPQKPARRAFERDPVAVERWLAEEYPGIRAQAKKERAEIHWGDEMGLRSDHQAGTSWGRKGRTPVIPCPGRRFGCNLISTVTNRGTLRFMVFTGKFNSGVLIRFLGRLLRSTRRKVFLIVDGHPTHKARKVGRWVADHGRRLRLFYLPAYSPELNPDEFLNNEVKSNAVGRRRAATAGELVGNVRGYLRSTQRQPKVVRSYFQAKSVRYAA